MAEAGEAAEGAAVVLMFDRRLLRLRRRLHRLPILLAMEPDLGQWVNVLLNGDKFPEHHRASPPECSDFAALAMRGRTLADPCARSAPF